MVDALQISNTVAIYEVATSPNITTLAIALPTVTDTNNYTITRTATRHGNRDIGNSWMSDRAYQVAPIITKVSSRLAFQHSATVRRLADDSSKRTGYPC